MSPLESELGPCAPVSAAANARTRRCALEARVRSEIAAAGGAIDFARFMELALYAPGLGYYVADESQLGAAGDFVTAPELGSLYGRCLARQCAEVLEIVGGGGILEVGAGSGALAADILGELAQLGCVPQSYDILEISPFLRRRQRDTLARRVRPQLERVRWLEGLPDAGFRGVVIASELLDAMPVARFQIAEQGVVGARVVDDGGTLGWGQGAVDAALRERIEALGLPSGYVSEVNVHAEAWVGTLAGVVEAGLLLIVDYGFPMHEFYHPQRDRGTLMCHYRHRAHDDPLINVGLQDITAHVNFSAIAAAGACAGLEVLGYTQQAPFLMSLGLIEALEAVPATDAAAHARIAQEAKRLTLPSQMGELFKVLALGRGLAAPLAGFALQDHRARL